MSPAQIGCLGTIGTLPRTPQKNVSLVQKPRKTSVEQSFLRSVFVAEETVTRQRHATIFGNSQTSQHWHARRIFIFMAENLHSNSCNNQAVPVRARWERETRTGGGEKKGRQAEREMLSQTEKLVGWITTLAASFTKWLVAG